jgi:hypothetical protein
MRLTAGFPTVYLRLHVMNDEIKKTKMMPSVSPVGKPKLSYLSFGVQAYPGFTSRNRTHFLTIGTTLYFVASSFMYLVFKIRLVVGGWGLGLVVRSRGLGDALDALGV